MNLSKDLYISIFVFTFKNAEQSNKYIQQCFWSFLKFEAQINVINTSVALNQNHLLNPALELKVLPTSEISHSKLSIIIKV